MNVAAFLDRINYCGPIEPTASTLRAIHATHMRTVPFENLDIHLKRPISLDETDLFNKIVIRRRGGFCYELNGLLAFVLRELGYAVTLLSARSINADDSLSPEFDHLVLLVQIPHDTDRWLVDVGYGDSSIEPLRLDQIGEQLQTDRGYWLDRTGDTYRLIMREYDGSIEPQYAFILQPRQFDEFLGMCHYHQTSPESSFTRKRVCTLATIDGRITLSNFNLITTIKHQRIEQLLSSEEEYRQVLLNKFGIDLIHDDF
jgi:N-hydroxyarylamine O-acetyltransferase